MTDTTLTAEQLLELRKDRDKWFSVALESKHKIADLTAQLEAANRRHEAALKVIALARQGLTALEPK